MSTDSIFLHAFGVLIILLGVSSPNQFFDLSSDFLDARNMSNPLGAAGEFALFGLNDAVPKSAEYLEVFLDGRMMIHLCVHRRRQHHGRLGRCHYTREKIVADSIRQFAKDRRSGRSDDDKICLPSKGNMNRIPLAGWLCKEIRKDRVPRECLQGEGRDKLFCFFGHHHMDCITLFSQKRDQIARLVRGDTSGNP